MPSLNKVILMGHLTFDPETRYTSSGSAVCTLRLAMNHRYNTKTGETKEDVTFVDVDTWNRQAENCQKYLTKGDPVMVEGRLKMETWEDKGTGQKRSRLKVIAQQVQFMKSTDSLLGSQTSETAPGRPLPISPNHPSSVSQQPVNPTRTATPGVNEPMDDIPF